LLTPKRRSSKWIDLDDALAAALRRSARDRSCIRWQLKSRPASNVERLRAKKPAIGSLAWVSGRASAVASRLLSQRRKPQSCEVLPPGA
jgi:hypothetical protein